MVDTFSASPDSALRWVVMDVDCVCTGVLVLRTHQKGAAEAFVWVNYSTSIKQQKKLSVDGLSWLDSLPQLQNHFLLWWIDVYVRVFVRVCVCIFVSRVANKPVCLCSPDFPVLSRCGMLQHFWQQADKEKCPHGSEQQTELCGHTSLRFGETFHRQERYNMSL